VNTGGGNLSLFTEDPVLTDYVVSYDEYAIDLSKDNRPVAVLDQQGSVLAAGQDVYIYGAATSAFTNKNILGNYKITAVEEVLGEPYKKKLTLDDDFYFKGLWTGKLRVAKPYTSSVRPVVEYKFGVVKIVNNNTTAHTGRQCLAVTGKLTIEQERLRLKAGKKYLVSAWISSDQFDKNAVATYKNESGSGPRLGIHFRTDGQPVVVDGETPFEQEFYFQPDGPVIEGWQKITGEFEVPAYAGGKVSLSIEQMDAKICPGLYIDDIRIEPVDAGMKCYVYDKRDRRLQAVLDENHYATLYYYDPAGKLYLLEKETERGIMTVQESVQHQPELTEAQAVPAITR
jgi:hypothetical protein